MGILLNWCWIPSPCLEAPQCFSVNSLTRNWPRSPLFKVVGMTTYFPWGNSSLMLTSLIFMYWSVLPTGSFRPTK